MPYLGDYLGSLLEEVTRARVRADLEAVRVAEIYRSHPLLRNFPIPRVRLPQVEMDVPVLVSEAPEDEHEGPNGGKIDCESLGKSTVELLTSELRERGLKPTARDLDAMTRKLVKTARHLEDTTEHAMLVDKMASEFCREIPTLVRKIRLAEQKLSDKDMKAILEKVGASVKQTLTEHPPAPLRVRISPLTHQLKEVGDPARLARIKLSLVEEGVEWVRLEEEGEERELLVPE